MGEKLRKGIHKLARFLSEQRSNIGLAVLALGLGGFFAVVLLYRHMIPLLGVDLQQFEQAIISQYNDYDWARVTDIMSICFWLLHLFAGVVVDCSSDIYSRSPAKENLEIWKDCSTFKSNVAVHPEDRSVTLSTCSYEYDNARFVVLGVMQPIP